MSEHESPQGQSPEQPQEPPREQPGEEPAEMFRDLGRRIDEIPAVQAAEQAVRRAAAELRRAEQRYQEARQQASSHVKQLRESSVGDLVDSTLECVRKHPGPGLLVAALVGIFLGRFFRR